MSAVIKLRLRNASCSKKTMHMNALRLSNFKYLPLLALAAVALAPRIFADTIVTYPNPNQMVVTYTGVVEVPFIVLGTFDPSSGLLYTAAGTGDPDMPIGTVFNAVGDLVDVSYVNLNDQSEETDYGRLVVGGTTYDISTETWDYSLGGPIEINDGIVDGEVSIATRFGSIIGWFPLGKDPVNNDEIYANFDGGVVTLPDCCSTAVLLAVGLSVLLSATFFRRRTACC